MAAVAGTGEQTRDDGSGCLTTVAAEFALVHRSSIAERVARRRPERAVNHERLGERGTACR
jgi:hypothetical protein